MALLKALASALGGFREIATTDQIACDAGAMTVTPTGGTEQSLPDAIGGRVATVNGKPGPTVTLTAANVGAIPDTTAAVSSNRLAPTDLQNLCRNPNYSQGLLEDWTRSGTAVTLSNASTGDLPAGNPALAAVRLNRVGSTDAYIQHGIAMPTGTLRGVPCLPSEQFYIEAMVYCAVATTVATQPVGYTLANGVVGGTTQNLAVPAGVWTKISATLTMPASVVTASFRFRSTVNDTTVWATLFRFQRENGADIIRDASIVPALFYAPTRGQFFKALEASGAGRVATVTASVPSDPSDNTSIAFNHTTFVAQPGTLAQFVKTTLSLTDPQLAAIIASARSVTE